MSSAETRPAPVQHPSLINRMLCALKLQSSLYEEVEHDPRANVEGIYVIAIVSFAQAIGRALDDYLTGGPTEGIILPAIVGFVGTVIGLAIWSYLLYLIGTKLFRGAATPSEVWRTTGYARSPGIFFVLPVIGPLVNIWILIAYILAARQALDLSTGKTVAAVIVSAIPFILIQGIVILLLFG